MPSKRKSASSTITTNLSSGKKKPKRPKNSSRTTTETVDEQASNSDNNEELKQLTLLENGHVDFIYRDSDNDERPIYMILTPSGTQNKTYQRRVIFTKIESKEDQNLYYILIENIGKKAE